MPFSKLVCPISYTLPVRKRTSKAYFRGQKIKNPIALGNRILIRVCLNFVFLAEKSRFFS
jgi:hypothetical protein